MRQGKLKQSKSIKINKEEIEVLNKQQNSGKHPKYIIFTDLIM